MQSTSTLRILHSSLQSSLRAEQAEASRSRPLTLPEPPARCS